MTKRKSWDLALTRVPPTFKLVVPILFVSPFDSKVMAAIRHQYFSAI